jgi:hypothetical protein
MAHIKILKFAQHNKINSLDYLNLDEIGPEILPPRYPTPKMKGSVYHTCYIREFIPPVVATNQNLSTYTQAWFISFSVIA